MSDATPDADVFHLPGVAPAGMTPAGLQSLRVLRARRLLVLALNVLSMGGLGWAIWRVFAGGGWAAGEVVVFASFLIGAPWMMMGLWNAVIGLWVLHGPGGMASACPVVHDGDGDEAIRVRTAVVICLRNEDPARALNRLAEIRRSLDATGWGDRFETFAMSDTDDMAVAAEEERVFEALRPILGPGARYRRRTDNEGWKAGNLRDFLQRYAEGFELFLPLDSDSLMSGPEVLRLTRIMQKHPRLGILQGLVVGAPSDSLFARVFQFGMRHGMRSFTAGAAWWHGDCSAYWGHNALIRVKPFRDDCHLPIIPGDAPLGGHILSHDQIEATLMRRAGYECRVLPVEGESYEENPPTLLDFIKRDHRWCNGNMQYFGLVNLPGLMPMSRFQVFAAIAMYFGGPSWILMMSAVAWMLAFPPTFQEGALPPVTAAFGLAMFFVSFSVSLAPKIAGWIDVALTPGAALRYGGGLRFAIGAFVETVFSILIAPIASLAVTVFLVGLAMGKRISWSGQQRDLTRVSWGQAARIMWPQTLFGLGLTALVVTQAPGALPFAAPALAGFVLAIPFTVLTASPALGAWARRVGLCAIPEDFAPGESLRRVAAGAPELAPARAA